MQSKQAGNRIRQRQHNNCVAQPWIAANCSADHCPASGLAHTDTTPCINQDESHFVSGVIACTLLALVTLWLSPVAPVFAQQSPASAEQPRAGSNTRAPNPASADQTGGPATTSTQQSPSADNIGGGAEMPPNTTTNAMNPSTNLGRPSPNYEPSENISEDSSVSFPVDI